MIFKRFYNDKLAQASYLVGCAKCGEAIVVDPNRDLDQYLEAAAKEHLRITGVTETHIHADYLSGSRELAKKAGATLYLSGEGTSDWQYEFAAADGATLLHHGDKIQIGAVRLDVLRTPGHTPEHIAFLITDTAASSEPMGLLSGDFIFVGDVGRPDLLETAAGIKGTMEVGARTLFQSIRAVDGMPGHVLVWPGHGAGSACGKSLGAVPVSSMGYERTSNWALRATNEQAFVNEVLSGQPDPPAYFATMKKLNKEGPPFLNGFRIPKRIEDPVALGEAIVLDVRDTESFQAGFLPGSIHVPRYQSFITYVGSALPYDTDLVILAADEGTVRSTVYDLAMIGLDRVVGWCTPDILAGVKPLHTIQAISGRQLAALPPETVVLDVRNRSERDHGFVQDSIHIPLPSLAKRIAEVPRDRPIAVHCAGGVRSAVAASLLRRVGLENVSDVSDGYAAIAAAQRDGFPIATP